MEIKRFFRLPLHRSLKKQNGNGMSYQEDIPCYVTSPSGSLKYILELTSSEIQALRRQSSYNATLNGPMDWPELMREIWKEVHPMVVSHAASRNQSPARVYTGRVVPADVEAQISNWGEDLSYSTIWYVNPEIVRWDNGATGINFKNSGEIFHFAPGSEIDLILARDLNDIPCYRLPVKYDPTLQAVITFVHAMHLFATLKR